MGVMIESAFCVSLSDTEFRKACGGFATGVAVLTVAMPDGEPHGITINSFVSVSLDPPLVMAAIAHTSGQLPAFESGEYFAVNILSEAQKDISLRFARPGEHRFSDADWERGIENSPLLKGAISIIQCKVVERFDMGDHRIMIGEAVSASTHEGKPLLYFRSGYRTIADRE